MRGGRATHYRKAGVESPCGPALCGAESPYGLSFYTPSLHIDADCKNCLAIHERENARLRATGGNTEGDTNHENQHHD